MSRSIFQTLYTECNGFLELRAFKGVGAKKVRKQEFFNLNDTKKISAFVSEHLRKGFDLYYGISTRDGTTGGKDAVVAVPAVWCDIDFKSTPQDVAEKKLSEFPLPPTIIVESGGGLHCVPLNTEILTIDGWKKWDEVSIGETVLGYDTNKKSMEWTTMEGKILKDCDDLFEVKNHTFSAICTGGHRWVCDVRHGHQGNKLSENILVEIKDITNRRHKIILSAAYSNSRHTINISSKEAAILGWFATEGSITKPRKGKGQSFRISQSESKFANEIRSLLVNIPHREYKCHGDSDMITWLINPSWMRELWDRCGFTKTKNEADWSKFVIGLSDEARNSFIEAAFKGDGTWNRNQKVMIQNRGPIFDGLQLAIFLSGYFPSVTNGSLTSKAIRYSKPYRSWNLTVSPKGSGKVWCPKTTLGTWVMRQDDTICITGNCYWKLKEPHGKEDIEPLESTMRRIAMALDGDMSVAEIARILRIPRTKNFKYAPPRPVVLRHCNGAEYTLDELDEVLPSIDAPSSKTPATSYQEQNKSALEAIMTCDFMQLCRDNAATLPEPQWHAMISILAKEPGGIALIHKLSKPYPKYSRSETDAKILQVMNGTKPWTCSTLAEKDFVKCDFRCGVKSPVSLAYMDHEVNEDHVSNVSNVSNVGARKPLSSSRKQPVSNDVSKNASIATKTFTQELGEWIRNSIGSFSVFDIDREFNLRTRQEKNARSTALNRYIEKKLIYKDRAIRGKYHVISDEIDWIDPLKIQVQCYSINLPLGLNDMLNIPPKSIVIVAGATNSGKTALLLNMAALNLDAEQKPLYLMSEMGKSEYRSRLDRFTHIDDPVRKVPFVKWTNMRAAERSIAFHSVIMSHNPNGITFVDFLEDVGGEYFKLATHIREIYDALGDGVAVIAMQKRKDQAYGRGGEATAEKARLYLSLDILMQCNDFSVCALKIIKAKDYTGQNPNGKEVHFKLFRGTTIEAITPWQWLTDQQRDGMVKTYHRQFGERKPF